jgi:hypothetical protein
MTDKELSVREAGGLISSEGFADDAKKVDPDRLANRGERNRSNADDAERAPKKQKRAPEPELDDDQDDEAPEDDEAEGSNRDGGDDYGEDSEDDDSDAEDGDEGEGEDEAEERRADPLDKEYEVKVNGKKYTVKARELVAGYQRNEDYHQKTTALAHKGRELTAGHAAVAETYQRRLQRDGAVVAHVRQLLIGDMDSREMEELRARDPNAWMVQRTMMQDRIGKVDTVLHNIQQEHERHVGEFTKQRQQHQAATLEQELETIRRNVADWDDTGKAALASYLAKNGFTPVELENVTDARHLLIANKARLWDEYQAKKTVEPARKMKAAPKAVQPGQGSIKKSGHKQAVQRITYQKAREHARKTGDMRDAGRAIARMFK